MPQNAAITGMELPLVGQTTYMYSVVSSWRTCLVVSDDAASKPLATSWGLKEISLATVAADTHKTRAMEERATEIQDD